MDKPLVKPVIPGEKYNKSRNVLGGHDAMVKVFPFVNFFMFLFGIFTVPVEVLLRRDFGQRWFTVPNFLGGAVVLIFFALIDEVVDWFAHSSIYTRLMDLPTSQPSEHFPYILHNFILILCIYVLFSLYHFFRIWWRNKTDEPLYSYDDGNSRLERPTKYLVIAINLLATPFIFYLKYIMPAKARQKKNPAA